MQSLLDTIYNNLFYRRRTEEHPLLQHPAHVLYCNNNDEINGRWSSPVRGGNGSHWIVIVIKVMATRIEVTTAKSGKETNKNELTQSQRRLKRRWRRQLKTKQRARTRNGKDKGKDRQGVLRLRIRNIIILTESNTQRAGGGERERLTIVRKRWRLGMTDCEWSGWMMMRKQQLQT